MLGALIALEGTFVLKGTYCAKNALIVLKEGTYCAKNAPHLCGAVAKGDSDHLSSFLGDFRQKTPEKIRGFL